VEPQGREVLARHFRGELSLDEAVSAIKRRTRQYAKRQLTWFRSMKGAVEISADDRPPEACARDIAEHVQQRG
jgi:tRNA A37 N6-isopentenylltransferase MiaA